jgi:hypothetical protein
VKDRTKPTLVVLIVVQTVVLLWLSLVAWQAVSNKRFRLELRSDIEELAGDRFTGAEGKELEARIERLENDN